MEKHQKNATLNDPRGCGFKSRHSVEDLIALIKAEVKSVGHEIISTADAAGRITARPVTAPIAIPPFPRAAMDGFAIVAADSFGADLYTPAVLRVIGRSRPGSGYPGCMMPGQAVAIATGAPVPNGANAVIPVEMTELHGEKLLVREPIPPGKHVGQIGEDVKIGDCILPTGRNLRPQDIGILSGLGVISIQVVKKPVIAIVVTGDELEPAFQQAQANKITDMNSPMLRALVQRDGGNAIVFGPLKDDRGLIESTLQELAESTDVQAIFMNGGSSTGPEDYAPMIVGKLGRLSIHGVALRPASPTGYGTINQKPVLLIPGNPVSSLCAYDFFGSPIVQLLAGRSPKWAYNTIRGTLSQKVTSSLGRVDYVRVKYNCETRTCEPIATGGASILSGTTRAWGFIVVPADLEGYPPGTEVEINAYDSI